VSPDALRAPPANLSYLTTQKEYRIMDESGVITQTWVNLDHAAVVIDLEEADRQVTIRLGSPHGACLNLSLSDPIEAVELSSQLANAGRQLANLLRADP
jgi:hypothetical protein